MHLYLLFGNKSVGVTHRRLIMLFMEIIALYCENQLLTPYQLNEKFFFKLKQALDEGGWLTQRPGRLSPGKDPVPILQEAKWAPGPVWTGA